MGRTAEAVGRQHLDLACFPLSRYPVGHVRTLHAPDFRRVEAEEFGLDAPPAILPRYNVAPTQPVLAVGLSKDGRPVAATFRWGIVPPWSADPKPGPINARSEAVADKPTFAEAFRKRRCLSPAA